MISTSVTPRVWLDGLTQHLGYSHDYEDVGESQRLIFRDEDLQSQNPSERIADNTLKCENCERRSVL